MVNKPKSNDIFERSKARVKNLGEVFTPEPIVEDMLNLLDKKEKSLWANEDIIFFEPTCGHGNIVVAILKRRLNALYRKKIRKGREQAVLYAVANSINTIWAIDIDKKNIDHCRSRVYTTILDFIIEKLKIDWDSVIDTIDDDFMLNLLCAIFWHVHENEMLSALISPEEFSTHPSTTKSSAKWIKKNGHHALDFEMSWCARFESIKQVTKNKKIIAVGNPPYQESDGGFGKSAKSIYNYFVEALMDSNVIDEFVLVIPARWFGGGKGLNNFRSRMIKSRHIKNLKYFSNAREIFPTVDINGGVCFVHLDKCHDGQTQFTDAKNSELVNLNDFDIIPDDPLAFALIKKILSKWQGRYVGEVAWPSKPFGLRTDYFNKHESLKANSPNAIPCLSRNKIIKYVSLDDIAKNQKKINLWKVSVPKAAGGSKGKRRSTVPKHQIFLVDKGTVTTETYNIIECFTSKESAENFISYLQSDFARYLIGLRKITQDVPPDRWNWVPYMDVNNKWGDEEIYKYFGLTEEEQRHIKNKVQEWS